MKKTVQHCVTFFGLGLLVVSLQGCQASFGLMNNKKSNIQAAQNTRSDGAFKPDKKKSAEIRVQIAAEYLRTGDVDAAKRALDEVFKETTRNARANMLMAVLLQQEGSPENVAKADEYFKRAISLDPDDAQTRNNYGRYLFQLGRYNDALSQLQVAGAKLGYDQRGLALENLGLTYIKLGDVPNAEKTFRQALQVNRNSAVSMLELAEIFYLRQQFAQANEMYGNYARVVGDNNQDARGLWVGIRVARANGDNMSKQVLVNQLRALFPNSQEYQRYLQLQYSTEAVWK